MPDCGPSAPNKPRALVLACKGASEGAISVVRTLGRKGVTVDVLSDDPDCEAGRSRYCKEFVCMPEYTRREAQTLEFLTGYARRQQDRPVLFPTADPDLLLVSRLRGHLESAFALFLSRPEIIDTFTDKAAFRLLSARHGFPVPETHAPASRPEVAALAERMHFPVVLKPSNPTTWTEPRLQAAVGGSKALIVESPAKLLELWTRLAALNPDLLIQEYIQGPDESHYSLHVYMNRQSEPLALFTGRKVRVFPAHAGSGCFVQSVRVPELIEVGTKMLRDVDYTGIAVLNFKQDSVTGQFRLHEINPRISQWNILATACGVNIPYLAYAEAAGLSLPACDAQRENVQYVNLRNDFKAFLEYRRCGEWSWKEYLSTLARPRTVYQIFAADDPQPFILSYVDSARAIVKRLARAWPLPAAPRAAHTATPGAAPPRKPPAETIGRGGAASAGSERGVADRNLAETEAR